MKKQIIFITLALTVSLAYAQSSLDSLHTVINDDVKQTMRVLEKQIDSYNAELSNNNSQSLQANLYLIIKLINN